MNRYTDGQRPFVPRGSADPVCKHARRAAQVATARGAIPRAVG